MNTLSIQHIELNNHHSIDTDAVGVCYWQFGYGFYFSQTLACL